MMNRQAGVSTRVRSRSLAVITLIAGALVSASCGQSPTSPLPDQPPRPSAPVTVIRIEVVAPAQIASGQSMQLTAIAFSSDGSVEQVDNLAQWTTTAPGTLTVTSVGLAAGHDRGEARVSAEFGGRSGEAKILVLPTGTVPVAGTVAQNRSPTPGRPHRFEMVRR